MILTAVTVPSLAYMLLGGFGVAFTMFLRLAKEKFYINEVVLGTLFGIFIGPYFAGIFDPRKWSDNSDAITLEVARIVLAIGLFIIGAELPPAYMAKKYKSLLKMIVPTMAIGWVIVAGLLRAIFPKLDFISCLGIAACLTPTDPVISAAIISGKFSQEHVPEKLRDLISAESAANDGLAYPFLTFAIYLTLDRGPGKAITDWILVGCLYQVVLGIFVGAIIGCVLSRLMRFSHDRGYIGRESYLAQYLLLAMFVIGVVSTIGSDDLLAAFAAGCAISWDSDEEGHNFHSRTKGQDFASIIDLVINCAGFIYIGAWLPFDKFTIPELGISPPKLISLALMIMLLRRIPAILVLYKWIPEIETFKEALFAGHFGPMGVGAVFISTLALHKLPTPADPPVTQQDYFTLSLQPIIAFVVLSSIIIHGLSIPLFSLGSRTLSLSRTTTKRSMPESVVEQGAGTTRTHFPEAV